MAALIAMGSMDDENVFLRDVTAGEQEYARSLLRGARVLYLAKVTKVEDRKLSVDGAGREHDAAPMERILVLGAYRLFSIKRRMTGLACIRQGHAQDLERIAYVEREGGRAVLQIEFRRGYEDRGGFLMTVPWETPTTSTLARSLWELWLRSGGALERRRPALEGHLLERLAASASLESLGDAPALHVALYSRLRHYVKRAPKPRTVSALTSAAVSGVLDLAMCADEDAGPASRAVSKLELYALGGVLRASTVISAVALEGHRPEADALQLLLGACAASPAVADLRLVDCGAAGAVLAQAPPFSERLEVLDLSGNGVGATGAGALAGLARGCGLLRALRLRRCDVGGGAAGFAALVRALLAAAEARRNASLAAALRGATAPAGPALRVLDLGENPLRDAGAAIVATFVGAASCRLRVLSVARCGAPLSELLRALREAARRDARLPAPLRGVAASLVRLDVSGNLLHPLARLGANEDARRLASVAEELPRLRELACGDLRYATTLSPAARGEDVAAVLDGALRRARRGLERLRVLDCSKSALSELKCPGGAWPEALLLDDGNAKSHRPVWALLDALGNAHSPPTSVSLARHGGLAALVKGATEPAEQRARLVAAASSCFANLDALHLQGAKLQRDLGPLVAALAGAAPKLRVLNVADAGGGDDGLEALGLLLSRSTALEQLACDGQRLGPQKVTLAGLRALRDGVLGAAEGPLLQLASPLADAARAARDRKDDAREIVACVRAMREAMRAQICDRAAPNSVPYDVLCVVTARAESDRCAGELDVPAPDGFVTTEAVAAFPAGDPPGAYDGDDDDGDPAAAAGDESPRPRASSAGPPPDRAPPPVPPRPATPPRAAPAPEDDTPRRPPPPPPPLPDTTTSWFRPEADALEPPSLRSSLSEAFGRASLDKPFGRSSTDARDPDDDEAW